MESYEEGEGEGESSYNPKSDGISMDLFVSKTKRKSKVKVVNSGGGGLCIKFTDSVGNLVFSVNPPPSSHSQRLVSDSSGNPLISIAHHQKATWEVFTKDLIFKVERTTNTLTRVEFQVFLNNNDNSTFKMRGSPFHRSCTIYTGDSVVAQTSLMYKLGIQKVFVPRNRFRLTIFPGYADHAFIVALTAIFFYGRKLWI